MESTTVFRRINTKESYGLVDRTVNEIERLIISGELAPDSKLPPAREFAEQLGVSRTVIREAVRILEAKGLVETRHGVGSAVRRPTNEQVVEPLHMLLRTYRGQVTFEELHEVRSILEIEIAARAALHATGEDIALLRQTMRDMEKLLNRPELFAVKDADFHNALGQATHNTLLMILSDSVRGLLKEYLALVIPRLDLSEKVMPYHLEILRQIERRSEEGARQAMAAHLAQIRRNHAEAFGSAN
ncbi:MAG TPA: FadR/GntR family transcriptional regulator [Anaerolineae bacterium]|nr:FadR/GntR family transcriptional regulator [Anaerolineae bacterium]